MLAFDHSAWSEWWPAPAKLNLMLHVVGRRDDGYHLLQTLFQILEAGDSLKFSPRDDLKVVRVGGLEDVPQDEDLVVRAAIKLFDAAGVRFGVDIHLNKHTPAGGGLGGGSSDAATVLVVLNQLFELNLSLKRLCEIGISLGADVPVFIQGNSAWAEGVGEDLQAVELEEQWFVVATPDQAVSTADVFTHPDLPRDTPRTSLANLLAQPARLPGRNDCQSVVVKQFAKVRELLELMQRLAGNPEHARMTGTGSSVFLCCDSLAEAEQIAQKLPDCVQIIITKGVNRSPLQNKCQKRFSLF